MPKYFKRLKPLLGTYVEIGTYSHDPVLVENAVSQAFKVIEQVQNRLSFHDPRSDLSAINKSSNNQTLEIEKVSAVVLRLARFMTSKSDGRFNLTVGGRLVNLNRLPNHHFSKPRDYGDCKNLRLWGKKVIKESSFQITLDGIAKGYAVDLAIKELQKCGLSSAWVNAGGDLRVYGEISLPIYRRGICGAIQYLTHLQNAAIATSQTNNSDFVSFPSILVTNQEIEFKSDVWTVVAPRAWLADALTKVAIFSSPMARSEILAQFGGRLVHAEVGL